MVFTLKKEKSSWQRKIKLMFLKRMWQILTNPAASEVVSSEVPRGESEESCPDEEFRSSYRAQYTQRAKFTTRDKSSFPSYCQKMPNGRFLVEARRGGPCEETSLSLLSGSCLLLSTNPSLLTPRSKSSIPLAPTSTCFVFQGLIGLLFNLTREKAAFSDPCYIYPTITQYPIDFSEWNPILSSGVAISKGKLGKLNTRKESSCL